MINRAINIPRIEDALEPDYPETPDIVIAAYGNSLSNATRAIESNPGSINAKDPFRLVTALHVAVMHGSVSMVQFLLRQPGIDVTIPDGHNRSALELAIIAGHPTVKRDLFAFRAAQLGLDGSKHQVPRAP